MKKLKLDLETLEALSFPTLTESETLPGTVHAEPATLSACGFSCRGTSVCCETA